MGKATKIKGIDSILHDKGVAFRLWASYAQKVSVIGSFNNWKRTIRVGFLSVSVAGVFEKAGR